MRRFATATLVALIATVMVAATSNTASAKLTSAGLCDRQDQNCHIAATLMPMTATFVAKDSSVATYTVRCTGATSWAAYKNGVRVPVRRVDGRQYDSVTEDTLLTFSVPLGGSYVIYAAKGPTRFSGYGKITIATPAPPDVAPPTTSSDAQPTYIGSSIISLSATDPAPASGVAATYFSVDAGPTQTGTAVPVEGVGAHSLEFWSVDASGHAEAPHKTADFTITAPSVDTTAPITACNAAESYIGTATIMLAPFDNLGGIGTANTYYRIDESEPQEGRTIVNTTPGLHLLEYWSQDALGNAEEHKLLVFGVYGSTAIALKSKSASVTYGYKPSVAGTLSAGNGLDPASRQVSLEYSSDNKTWKSASKTATTVADGAFTIAASAPTSKTYYRVLFPSASDMATATSSSFYINPGVYLSTPYAPSYATHGRAFTSYGDIGPRHTTGTSPVYIYCYRYQSGTYVYRMKASAKVSYKNSSVSKYSRSLVLPYAGKWRLRAYAPADSAHAATWGKSYRYVTVR